MVDSEIGAGCYEVEVRWCMGWRSLWRYDRTLSGQRIQVTEVLLRRAGVVLADREREADHGQAEVGVVDRR